MTAIYALWLREIKRYTRSPIQIVISMAQPIFYMLILGFGLSPVFQRAGAGNYVQFVAPGIIGMSILFSSVFSGMGLLWDRQFGFLKETLVAPIPRIRIMIGRTLGAATVAVMQGTLVMIVCIIAGFRPVRLELVPEAFLFMLMIATVFSGLGTAIGAVLKEIQGFQMVMTFLVMPIFFLSGALFPLTNLPAFLSLLTRLDPLSYGVDGLRGALIVASQFGATLDVLVLAVVASLFIAMGAYSFSRIEI
jgi:ABC-2 type transport system permease protein